MIHRRLIPVLLALFLLGLLVSVLGGGMGIMGVRAQGPAPEKRLQVSTPVPVPPQMEPVPTPTPTVDPNTKQEFDRQSAAVADPLSSPPANDDFNDALLITSLPYQDSVDTSGATVAPDDPDMGCGAGVNSNTVWYRFSASSSQLVEANTFGSDYDTVLAVFTGTRGALNWIACNDDTAGTLRSQLLFEAEAGRTYYVEVADYGSPGGGLADIEIKVDPSGATKARRLEYGDDLIHGFTYYDGFLWASTRTYPARILKIDPDTLDYQRIVLSSGLNDGEDLIAAAGYVWVILHTDPARIVRVDPETLQWAVAITFGSSELSWGGSLEYAFGYLWAGGYDRKIARISLTDLTYQTYAYPTISSYSQFHALTSGGAYMWASAPHHSSWQGWSADTIVRINPDDPTDYSTVYVDRAMSDDMAYSNSHLFTGSEFTAGNLHAPSYLYRFADDLTYDSTYAFDHGSYGIFADNDEIWSAHVGSPGRIIEFGTNLAIQAAHNLPIGFNNANEMAFDPGGNIYVTAWESPAGLVKFAPTHGVDLDLTTEPLSFCDDCAEWQSPYLPNQVVPQLTVRNDGSLDASNVVVEFFDGDPTTTGVPVGSTAVGTIPSGDQKQAGILWALHGNYEGTIYAKARCDEAESNYANNTTSHAVSIYYVDFRHDKDAFSFPNWSRALSDLKSDLLALFLDVGHPLDISAALWVDVVYPRVKHVEESAHCYGMAATSYWYWKDDSLRPAQYASTYAIPGDATGPTDDLVRSDIQFFQRRQMLHLFEIELLPDSYSANDEYEGLLKEIKNLGNPTALLMFDTAPPHSVLAYKIIDTGQDKTIYVYDSNFPLTSMTHVPTAVFNTTHDSFLYTISEYVWTVAYSRAPYLGLPEEAWVVLRNLFFDIINALLNRGLLEVFVGSPVEPLITDQYGRRIGYAQGSFVNEIPGAEMIALGEDNVFYIPNNLTYTVETFGTDTGELDLTFIVPVQIDRVLAVSYEDVPVAAGSHTETTLSKTNEDWTMVTDQGPRDPDTVEEYRNYKTYLPLILRNY